MNFLMFVWLLWRLSLGLPGSSKCVKFCLFTKKNLPKGRNFTYLEDAGVYIYLYIYGIYIYYYIPNIIYIADVSTILASTMPWLLGILLGTLNNPF